MWRPLAEKFQRNPRIFSSRPVGPLGLYKKSETEFQNFPPFLKNLGKTVFHFCPFLI